MDKLEKFFKAAWEYIKQAKIELIVLVAALVVDLITKALVNANIPLGGSVTVIPNFLYFTYIHNYAAAFGSRFGLDKIFGETGTMVFFIVLTFIAIGFFGYFMYRNRAKSLVFRLAFALIIGGAIGNLVDRMAFGYVRDFVQIVYFGATIFGSTSFAIFNIADAALCVGVALFLIYYIFIYKEPKKDESLLSDGAANVDSEQAPPEAAPEKTEVETDARDQDDNDNR